MHRLLRLLLLLLALLPVTRVVMLPVTRVVMLPVTRVVRMLLLVRMLELGLEVPMERGLRLGAPALDLDFSNFSDFQMS